MLWMVRQMMVASLRVRGEKSGVEEEGMTWRSSPEATLRPPMPVGGMPRSEAIARGMATPWAPAVSWLVVAWPCPRTSAVAWPRVSSKIVAMAWPRPRLGHCPVMGWVPVVASAGGGVATPDIDLCCCPPMLRWHGHEAPV